MMGRIVEVDPVSELQAACAAAGSQLEWGRRHGISQPYISDILRGRRDASERILRILGLRRAVVRDHDP